MSTVKEEDRTKLEKFDGSDASTYRKWRRKAELMLLTLPTTFEKSRWGPKLCEYIAGEAEELVEHISIQDLCKENGYKLVLRALDEKYAKRKEEEAQFYLKEYLYKDTIKQGETYRQCVVRHETTYRRLAEHGIDLPEQVKGWLLLKKLVLDSTQEALVLTSTGGSLKYNDVTTSLTKVMPEGKCLTNPKHKDVFLHEELESYESPEAHGFAADEEAEVFEAIADIIQEQDGEEEEDALEVYETYAEVRKKIQSKKVSRGFRPTASAPAQFQLHGTVQAKIQQLKEKTRSHMPESWTLEERMS